jgi:Cytochrome c554 and c-prime
MELGSSSPARPLPPAILLNLPPITVALPQLASIAHLGCAETSEARQGMDSRRTKDMTEPTAPLPANRRIAVRVVGVVALLATVLGLATLGTCGWDHSNAPTYPDDKGKEPTVGGLPLFSGWPKGQKPDAVILLSGETFGFLQPCGCSRPQMGGLERRAVFVKSLKNKGWPVVGLDLGDLYPQKTLVQEQSLLKYKTTMNALRDMGYVAVGLGKTEFDAGIDKLLGEYALQKEQTPFTLAGNLKGVGGGKEQSREDRFPPPPGATRPMVGLAEIALVNEIPIGVVGIVGKSLGEEIKKLDPSFAFDDNAVVLKKAIAALDSASKKPQVKVLLYQGSSADAALLAKDFQQFQIILCQSDDPEPPQFPMQVNDGKTLLIQVGHKGRYVGVVGAFKTPDGVFDLKYQLVPLSEEYITPGTEDAARKTNFILPLLDTYSEQVRDRRFLTKVPKTPHPAQLQEQKLNLSYIGSEKCQACHAAETAKWKDTPHSKALDALEKIAKRPSLRNFDGECVQCHVVGLTYKTGYEDQKKTPQLAHVGCESCHGPGSGHAAHEKNASLLALQMPWKSTPGDKLPDIDLIKKIGELPGTERGKVAMKPIEQRVVNLVSTMCAKCHDPENDPHFDFYTYWPKINHTFPKPAGGKPPGK